MSLAGPERDRKLSRGCARQAALLEPSRHGAHPIHALQPTERAGAPATSASASSGIRAVTLKFQQSPMLKNRWETIESLLASLTAIPPMIHDVPKTPDEIRLVGLLGADRGKRTIDVSFDLPLQCGTI